jgi:hypothetical protein
MPVKGNNLRIGASGESHVEYLYQNFNIGRARRSRASIFACPQHVRLAFKSDGPLYVAKFASSPNPVISGDGSECPIFPEPDIRPAVRMSSYSVGWDEQPP